MLLTMLGEECGGKSLVGTHDEHEIEEVMVRSNHDNLLQHHVQDLIGFHRIDL